MKRFILLSLMLVALAGCSLVDETPEGKHILTPEAARNIDAGISSLEGAAEVAAGASLIWPGAGAIAIILTTIAGTAKRLRPKIESANNIAELSSAALYEVVMSVENYKKEHPEAWEKLASTLKTNVSNVSRTEISRIKSL